MEQPFALPSVPRSRRDQKPGLGATSISRTLNCVRFNRGFAEEAKPDAVLARARSGGGRSREVTHARLGPTLGTEGRSGRVLIALRSRPFLSRPRPLTFGRSTRRRLTDPFHFPRANDLGMSWLVHFHLTRRRFGLVVAFTEKSSTIERA